MTTNENKYISESIINTNTDKKNLYDISDLISSQYSSDINYNNSHIQADLTSNINKFSNEISDTILPSTEGEEIEKNNISDSYENEDKINSGSSNPEEIIKKDSSNIINSNSIEEKNYDSTEIFNSESNKKNPAISQSIHIEKNISDSSIITSEIMKDIKSNDEIINYSSDKYTYTSDNKVEDSSNFVSNSTKNENDLSDIINETTFDSSYGSAINSDFRVRTSDIYESSHSNFNTNTNEKENSIETESNPISDESQIPSHSTETKSEYSSHIISDTKFKIDENTEKYNSLISDSDSYKIDKYSTDNSKGMTDFSTKLNQISDTTIHSSSDLNKVTESNSELISDSTNNLTDSQYLIETNSELTKISSEIYKSSTTDKIPKEYATNTNLLTDENKLTSDSSLITEETSNSRKKDLYDSSEIFNSESNINTNVQSDISSELSSDTKHKIDINTISNSLITENTIIGNSEKIIGENTYVSSSIIDTINTTSNKENLYDTSDFIYKSYSSNSEYKTSYERSNELSKNTSEISNIISDSTTNSKELIEQTSSETTSPSSNENKAYESSDLFDSESNLNTSRQNIELISHSINTKTENSIIDTSENILEKTRENNK